MCSICLTYFHTKIPGFASVLADFSSFSLSLASISARLHPKSKAGHWKSSGGLGTPNATRRATDLLISSAKSKLFTLFSKICDLKSYNHMIEIKNIINKPI